VADGVLLRQRQSVSHAVSAPGQGMPLIAADAAGREMTDPAFAAHLGQVISWARAAWEGWLPHRVLDRLLVAARSKLCRATRPWPRVTGPASAMVAAAMRLGWSVTSATELITDLGETLKLHISSPGAVSVVMQRAVRRWQWRNVTRVQPALHASTAGALFKPIRILLHGTGSCMPSIWRAGLRTVFWLVGNGSKHASFKLAL
jgi:hypothetical protein